MKINMACLRLLLSSGLIFIIATAFPIKQDTKSELHPYICCPEEVTVVDYNIELIPLTTEICNQIDVPESFLTYIEEVKNDFIFYGQSNVTINITRSTQLLYFRLPRMIDMWEMNLFKVNARKKVLKIHAMTEVSNIFDSINGKAIDSTNTIFFHLEKELNRGYYILNIEFLDILINDDEGSFFGNSYLNVKRNERMWLLAIRNLQTLENRLMLPCWIESGLKANFTIFLNNYHNYTALLETPVQVDYTVKNNTAWMHFSIRATTSIYLIIFSNFVKFSNKDTELWYRSHLQHINFAWNVIKNVTTYLKNEWNMMDTKIIHVAMPNFQDEGEETQKLVFYREEDILYDNILDHPTRKMEITHLITLKMAYQLFGKSMSSWLIEGLAMMLEADIMNQVLKSSYMTDWFIIQFQYESLHFNAYCTNGIFLEVKRLSRLFTFPCYRAPFLLRMLRYLMTDEIFWKGVRKYLNTSGINLTNLDDFWTAMQTTLEESDSTFKLNITTIVNDWIKQKQFPKLILTRAYDMNEVRVGLENWDFSEDFQIPLAFTTQTELNFNRTSYHDVIWLKKSNVSPIIYMWNLTEIENGWIIANLKQAGYYRITYDYKNWRRIIKYLNSTKYEKIDVLNRAKIIDDAFHLMLANRINPFIFWNITSYLKQETDYRAWYPMFKIFEYISSIYPFSDRRVEDIKNRINEILNSLLIKIGYEENSNENELTKYLRQEATKWACILDNSECINMTYIKLLEYLKDQETNKLLPWWEKWKYCKGLMSPEFTVAHMINIVTLSEKFYNKSLEFLTCSKIPYVIHKYLDQKNMEDKEAKNIGKIQNNRHVKAFLSVVAKHADNKKILTYILKNFNEIKPRQVSLNVVFTVIINHIYSKEQLQELRKDIRRIMSKEIYITIVKRVIKERFNTHVHKENINKVMEENFVSFNRILNLQMLHIRHKINMRLSEIKTQETYLERLLHDARRN